MNMKMKMVLAERLKRKHPALYSVSGDMMVHELASMMMEKEIGSVLVEKDPEAKGEYAGICTERDIIRCCAKHGNLGNKKVSDIMVTEMIKADINDVVQNTIRRMYKHHIRHILLTEKGFIVALISIRDLMYCVDMEREITMSHLNDMTGASRYNRNY
jgi:signal-transduction protein with cAMP-binding, CBS, and nucleotidyltransferase domain